MKQSTVILGIVGVLVLLGVGYFLMNNQNTESKQAMSEKTTTTAVTGQKTMNNKTIVQVAQEAGNFKTLVAAIKAAGLVDTLSGTGPFTVFAPTDEAFAKLPAGTVESLLKDKEKLVKILTYHVVAGKVMAKDVVNLTSAKTVEGGELTIKVDAGKVMVDNANVVTTDIEASNGVIHVVDSVLMPQ
ncbi:hypothetical protein BH09PAT1_BH09PAT1_2270 [soil metagenome]